MDITCRVVSEDEDFSSLCISRTQEPAENVTDSLKIITQFVLYENRNRFHFSAS